ncbi:hypothetical protein IJJ37_01490 [Candidatus Saccharibacteria bacterium]|nr:hypothetical protein [Candidatus Saccharibacteria bacterium]
MDYLHKYSQNPFPDLFWNIPEQKSGTVNVIGGNAQNFRTPVKTAETLLRDYPIKTVNLVLPDVLKPKLPPLDNLIFLSSTDSGSFGSADELSSAMNAADSNLLIGDLSKNSITKDAVLSALSDSATPVIITRDAVDLVADTITDSLLLHDNLAFLVSMPQLQKLFRAVYYPKMLTLTQPFIQVAEALHKFTLSYAVKIVTMHDGQIIVAVNGNVSSIPLDKTSYTPLTFWLGAPAIKILAMNLFNPNNFECATVSSLF